MPHVFESLVAGKTGVVTYGITPPKRSWSAARIADVATAQAARIRDLEVDGVVVYDLQDESSRTDAERPFPYEEPLDPVWYAHERLGDVGMPRIVYRCVARLEPQDLATSLDRLGDAGDLTVLVGAASSEQRASMSLREAYELRRQEHADVPVGIIPAGTGNEHLLSGRVGMDVS